MNLISVNNTNLDNKMQWEFSFDAIVSIPSIVFKIQQSDAVEKYKYVSLSEIALKNSNKVIGVLYMTDLFDESKKYKKTDKNDKKIVKPSTTEIDVQKEYIIREVEIEYSSGEDIITFSVNTNIPLNNFINQDNAIAAQAQQQSAIDGDLYIYYPGYLDRPFGEYAEVYIAEIDPKYSYPALIQPELVLEEELNKLLVRDSEEDTYEFALQEDGNAFILAEEVISKTGTKSLEAIEPLQIKIYRTNRAIAWLESFDLENNNPIEKEGLITSDTIWSKRGLQYNQQEYKILDPFKYSNLPGFEENYRKNHYIGKYVDYTVDSETQPEKIQNEYTEIVITDFGEKESIL